MISNLSNQKISAVFRKAIKEGFLNQVDDTAILFYDLSLLEEKINNLVELFPKGTLHAVAIKANPLSKILRRLNKLGLGAEAASLPELHIAINAGFSPNRIVFDSPVKTTEEIEYALNLGVHINADSFSELDCIDRLIKGRSLKGSIGVRINPQVGTGKILSTSVAGEYSKFGVPINEYREDLIEKFLTYDWLTCVHLHIGSQGISLEQLIRGFGIAWDFMNQVNNILKEKESTRKVNIFDFGGGLPVSYDRAVQPISMVQYQEEIKKLYPAAFTNQYKLITEFGRYIHTNAGWAVSRVENVKRDQKINTAMIHVGADMFLRECYNPNDWHHEITVLDVNGKIKTGRDENKYMLAGPLCFAGDIVAREISLPKVEIGDYIVIRDSGGYTLGMWSRYNSRQVPKVVGYYDDGKSFEVLKKRESIENILDFWA